MITWKVASLNLMKRSEPDTIEIRATHKDTYIIGNIPLTEYNVKNIIQVSRYLRQRMAKDLRKVIK